MSRAHLHQPHNLADRLADWVAAFVGSWRFVVIQTILMGCWVGYNAVVAYRYVTLGAFDPFPFVFLNLFMSAEAAYSTPFIMMSQNRQANRDRARDDLEADEVARLLALNETQIEILHAIHEVTAELHQRHEKEPS